MQTTALAEKTKDAALADRCTAIAEKKDAEDQLSNMVKLMGEAGEESNEKDKK